MGGPGSIVNEELRNPALHGVSRNSLSGFDHHDGATSLFLAGARAAPTPLIPSGCYYSSAVRSCGHGLQPPQNGRSAPAGCRKGSGCKARARSADNHRCDARGANAACLGRVSTVRTLVISACVVVLLHTGVSFAQHRLDGANQMKLPRLTILRGSGQRRLTRKNWSWTSRTRPRSKRSKRRQHRPTRGQRYANRPVAAQHGGRDARGASAAGERERPIQPREICHLLRRCSLREKTTVSFSTYPPRQDPGAFRPAAIADCRLILD